jgi:dTDP-4-amino-4,6-dideoxygalactose transaminase
MMNVPLLDLKPQYQLLKEEILSVTEEIYESQQFILGPWVQRLETRIASYCQSAHAVGVSSGSDALLLCLMACGIGPGHGVLTTPYTFFATAGSVVRTGAKPVFVDIDPQTYNIDPEQLALQIDRMTDAERSRLRAVIPVHLYGQCAEMAPIVRIARQNRLVVIEDAAQAIGAEYQGRRAGSIGDFGCFSFFPSKNLGAFGDGGMVTTQDAERFERLCTLRNHGARQKYYHQFVGGNFRLDALQAAVVSIKLKYLDAWTWKRQQNAARYRELFESAGLMDRVRLPLENQSRHIYNQFVIRVSEGRDELRRFLSEAGVGNEIYYPVPLHLQACFSDLGYRPGDLPESEKAAQTTLALPIYPDLTEDQQAYVVDRISAFYKR